MSILETFLFEADTRYPDTAKAVGGGFMGALASGRAIMAHRERGDTLHAYTLITARFDGATDAIAQIVQAFDGWAPELTALLTETDVAPVLRPTHSLPVGQPWARVPGVTLLGDAAHLAPPNGEGANLALFDGAELARLLAAQPDDPEAALATFEAAMFERSAASATEGAGFYDTLMSEDPARDLIAMVTQHAQITS